MADLTRRFLMGAASALSGLLGGAAAAQTRPPAAPAPAGKPPINIRRDGSYETVALAKPRISVSIVQTGLLNVRPESLATDVPARIAYVADQFDAVFNYFGARDLVVFHPWAIHGWDKWTKPEIERFAIRFPGPEAEMVAAKCRQYGCWAAWGGYVVEPDWPGHVIDMQMLTNPAGEIVAKHWKTSNWRAQMPTSDYFVTTIYDVLDAYVERYGWDATVPIARTPIGNIFMSTVLREPEVFRIAAFKGAEVFIRAGLGGYSHSDGELISRINRCFTAFASNAISPGNRAYFPDNGTLGRSRLYNTRGQTLAEADKFETSIQATFDLAERRAIPRVPDINMDMYMPALAAYQSRYAPNGFARGAPDTLQQASDFLRRTTLRWR